MGNGVAIEQNLTHCNSQVRCDLSNTLAGANSLAQEALGNMRTLSAFNGQKRTIEKYSKVGISCLNLFA